MNKYRASSWRDLPAESIDKCFQNNCHQRDVLEDLYRLVLPEWDIIESVDGWPSVSHDTNNYIMMKAIAFDKVHHPKVMAGGFWVNSGFQSRQMENWKVDVSTCKVTVKGDHHEGR